MKEEKNSGKGNVFKNAGSAISKFFKWIGADLKEIGTTFAKGDWKTRVSYFIMGLGQLMRKQFARGIAFLGIEVAFILYIAKFASKYLVDLATLGTHGRGFNPDGTVSYGDNSFLILLYSVLSIIIILAFILVWRMNVRDNRKSQLILESGKALPTNRQDLHSLLDHNFDKTLLALPCLGIFIFTVVPIIFMICIAFTN